MNDHDAAMLFRDTLYTDLAPFGQKGDQEMSETDRKVREALLESDAESEAQRKLAIAKSFGPDNYETGQVIRFTKRYPQDAMADRAAAQYSYAAVKSPDQRWFLTQNAHQSRNLRHPAMTWRELLVFLVTGIPVTQIEILDIVERLGRLDPWAPETLRVEKLSRLREHLHDVHRNLAADNLSLREAEDQHSHEHFGPGGLRNHTHAHPDLTPVPVLPPTPAPVIPTGDYAARVFRAPDDQDPPARPKDAGPAAEIGHPLDEEPPF